LKYGVENFSHWSRLNGMALGLDRGLLVLKEMFSFLILVQEDVSALLIASSTMYKFLYLITCFLTSLQLYIVVSTVGWT